MIRFITGALLGLALLGSAQAQNPGIIYSGTSPAANDCVKFINRTLVTTTGAACSTGATGANPTASVGLTAVNGSALTFMRSDAAPALDVTAAYAFSGLGNTTLGSGKVLNLDVGSAAAPSVNFGNAGTGFYKQGTNAIGISINGTVQSKFSNTVWEFGGVALSFSSSISAGFQSRIGAAGAVGSGTVYVDNNGSNFFYLTAVGAPTLQLGQANAAVPVAQILQAQGSRAGTDASTAGGNLSVQAGIGTGNSGKSSLILNGMIGAVATTSTAQTVAAGVTVPGVANGQLPGAVIGSAALATNASDGFLYIPSGAGPPTGTPTTFTGRVPLYYDSTNDQLYIYATTWKQPKTPAGAAVVNWQ